jgi:hypothetical protein
MRCFHGRSTKVCISRQGAEVYNDAEGAPMVDKTDDKRETKRAEITAAIEAYYSQVGRVASAWNNLQLVLGWIFERTVDSPKNNILRAIWHSQQSDRNQRRMLRAAIEAGAFSLPKSSKDDLLWLMKEADELSGRRDEAIHSPVALTNTRLGDPDEAKLTSLWFTGNPLAVRLRDKELIYELSLSEWRAARLTEYARAIHSAIHVQSSSWPSERPKLNRELHRQLESNHPYDAQ